MTNKTNPIQLLRSTLEGPMRAEIAKALPKDIDPDRFIRTVITVVQMNHDLAYADRSTLFAACMKAAADGLMPDGREAVLNIYKTKQGNEWVPVVQYLPMVRGILKTLRNTGGVASVDAAAVYEKDHFAFRRGDDPRIEHEPYLGVDDPGKVIAAYVIVRLANGEVQREVMPARDIEKVRAASKSADKENSPWNKWYDQMAIKSAVKRVAKLLPTSSERLDRIIQSDNEAMEFDFNQRGVDATAVITSAPAKQIEGRRPSRLHSIIQSSGVSAEPVETEQVAAQAEAAE